MSAVGLNHIKTIDVLNLLGERNIHWVLNDDVNVLSGTNGSGKSTVLRLCYQLLYDGDIVESRLLSLADGVRVVLSNDCQVEWMKGRNPHTLVTDSEGKTVEFNKIKDVIKPLYINSFELAAKDVVRMRRDEDNGMTTLDLMIREGVIERNAVFTGAMEKFFRELSHDQTIRQVIERNQDIANFMEFYDELQVFMSEYNVFLDNRIIFSKSGNIKFDYKGLSSGEKQILLLLLMVSNTNKKPCVFFMDEPDLALHIIWKQKLINELLKMNQQMQIILSTHSPSVIEGWYGKVREINQITV